MAESLLFSFAESLIGKLASLAVEEAALAWGVYDDLRAMKDSMALIRAVLLDAERKKSQDHALNEWLKQIKHVFTDAEDIVDDFECEALRKRIVNTHGNISRKVRRFFSTSNPLVYRLKMAHEIKVINKRLKKVADDRLTFVGLQIIEGDTRVVHVRETTHSHVNASNVIGREHDKEKIIELLLQDDRDKSLSVVPIVGMGGLGKTTLAKLVFNDSNIVQSFPLKMWVCVSNDFELRNVLDKILCSALNLTTENFEKVEVEQLQNRLRNTLENKKFLLVLDDVWNEKPAKWNKLKEIIETGVGGSKILVTTRNRSIAAMMSTKSSNSYFLEGLSEKDSLSLFVKSAFKEGEEKKDPQLLKIGKEIVKKCGGIPLAVTTIGSSLILKDDRNEWEHIRDNAIWNLQQNEEAEILPALQLSYNQLPSYLKPCFVCLSLFPQDFLLNHFVLGQLWGALDFLPSPKESETIDDVAIQFCRELWSRSFLVDFEEYGGMIWFKIHDLMHDLATYVGKGEFQIICSRSPKIYERAKHLAFHENNLLGQELIPTCLKSIIFPEKATNEPFLNTVVSRSKYLRVLHITRSEYESLPRSIGKLKHLRYLNLSNNGKLKGLPNSVCKLQNLQTLDLEDCRELQELPKGMRKLISLRQLYITTRQPNLPETEIGNLSSLKTLSLIWCNNLESLSEEIRPPNLKYLYLYFCKSLKSLSYHLIENLESLYIFDCDELELSMGLGNQIPDSKLKVLVLTMLSQLVTLPPWLQGSVNTLESLVISGCENLEELPEWLSTMICLKELRIQHCRKLPSLPYNMHHLTNLEHLEIIECPALREKYEPRIGPDWHKISHIKQVIMEEEDNTVKT